MSSWYKQTQNEAGLGENEYSANVLVETISSNSDNTLEIEINTTVYFKYKIEIEHRSWGIKSITTIFNDIVQVPSIIRRYDQSGNNISEEEKIFTLDMSKLAIDKIDGNGIFVRDLDIELDSNFEIDYKSSSITISGIG